MARTDCAAVRAPFLWLLVIVAATGFLFSGQASAMMLEDWRPDVSMYSPGHVVAVDLGNTNSCVAGYDPRESETSMFHLCIPSWVAFPDDGTVLVGEDARNHAAVNPLAAISGFKRLLGKRISSYHEREFLKSFHENLPYKVEEKVVASPHIQVKTTDGTVRHFGIEQIITTMIAKLKDMAETQLGHKVHAAILTLPLHHSNDPSREIVRFASTYGTGFDAIRMLSEPVAAAVAYDVHKKLPNEGNVLVLHVGGGTTEANVLTLLDGVYEARATHHDPFFGGHDFDRRVTDHFVRLIRDKHGKDIAYDGAAVEKLSLACERAKKTLSDQGHTMVTVESIVHGVNLSEPLTRADFEEMNSDLLVRVVEMVDTAVSQAELEKGKESIDEVVLIGGSTMIPKVQKLVADYFGGMELSTWIQPDEAVTVGAAIYSKWLYLKSQN